MKPSVPEDAQDQFNDALDGAVTPETQVRVLAKRRVAEGVVELVLEAIDRSVLPAWAPGAHVDLVFPSKNIQTRQYSLAGDPADRQKMRLGVLREQHAGTSQYIHDELNEGDVVALGGPRNHFRLESSPNYVFVAGGIGITPILPMLAAAERSGALWSLTYGGRTRTSMAFLDELEPYGSRVQIWPQDEVGLLDLSGLLAGVENGALIYCCGPNALLDALQDECVNWPKAAVHVERFSAKAITEPARKDAFDVYLDRSDRLLTVPPDRSILDVLNDAGVPVLSSCSEGTCGTCEVKVLAGEPDHRDSVLTDDEQAANDCLMVCVSRARTARIVLDL